MVLILGRDLASLATMFRLRTLCRVCLARSRPLSRKMFVSPYFAMYFLARSRCSCDSVHPLFILLSVPARSRFNKHIFSRYLAPLYRHVSNSCLLPPPLIVCYELGYVLVVISDSFVTTSVPFRLTFYIVYHD